jgi:hypothetical protein
MVAATSTARRATSQVASVHLLPPHSQHGGCDCVAWHSLVLHSQHGESDLRSQLGAGAAARCTLTSKLLAASLPPSCWLHTHQQAPAARSPPSYCQHAHQQVAGSTRVAGSNAAQSAHSIATCSRSPTARSACITQHWEHLPSAPSTLACKTPTSGTERPAVEPSTAGSSPRCQQQRAASTQQAPVVQLGSSGLHTRLCCA